MSMAPEPEERQLQLLQDQIYEQQDALNAYMVLARKPTQAATVVPLIFRTSVRIITFLCCDMTFLSEFADNTARIDKGHLCFGLHSRLNTRNNQPLRGNTGIPWPRTIQSGSCVGKRSSRRHASTLDNLARLQSER
jgi:hypothetical protein